MTVEVKQTKCLSYATQDSSLKSQIDAAQKIALIVCPEYDESHFLWRQVHTLMEQHAELGRKMSKLSEDNDFGINDEGIADNVQDVVDLSENETFELPVKEVNKLISSKFTSSISNVKDNVPTEIDVKSLTSNESTPKDNNLV